ncbi:DUF4136 domain-containing protein [uncultured Winogradskyella sp.]|uniref:DUF4136 domain-containing protein n=1 Tax=uncultured Winogradskyella sp. TaxID=395353 RepID=UPI002607F5D5|nr:DUF4136 domain-containing protein [uncultured Winogradskyella sp.]
MKLSKTFLCIILLMLFSCATAYDIIYDYNMNADFDSYTTFTICNDDLFPEKVTHPKIDNEKSRQYIANEVTKQMQIRNHKTNALNPELQAGFKIVVNRETLSFVDCSYSEEFQYWEECKITEETYNQESLILYVADYKTNTIIWQASTKCNLNKSKKNLEKHIQELVTKLYSTYPKRTKEIQL